MNISAIQILIKKLKSEIMSKREINKLRNILQNNWRVFFKSVRIPCYKEGRDWSYAAL